MTGLKRARIVWTVVFLGTTLAAIVMECVAGLWHPTGWTIPWTEYLARYVPWPIQLVAYVALAVWLPFHFWRHDRLRQVAYRRGYERATQSADTAVRIAYSNGHADGVAGKPHVDSRRAQTDQAMIRHAMDVGPVDWDAVDRRHGGS